MVDPQKRSVKTIHREAAVHLATPISTPAAATLIKDGRHTGDVLKSHQRMVDCGTGVFAPWLFCAAWKQFCSTIRVFTVLHVLLFG